MLQLCAQQTEITSGRSPDGAIWYAKKQKSIGVMQGLQSHTTPISEEGISAIEVDSNNHVWVIINVTLAYVGKAGFLLDPAFWLVRPGTPTVARSGRQQRRVSPDCWT
jgi:hypothetical protein